MPEVDTPFAYEVVGYRVGYGKSEQVLYLCREDCKGYACRKAYDYGVWNELDYHAEFEDAEQQQNDAGHYRGYGEAFDAELAYYACNDDYECASRASYLYVAAAEQGDYKAAYDGRNKTFFWGYAAGDTEGNGERKSHDADNDAGHEVCREFAAVIIPQFRKEFRVKV